jgi:rhodanese-related sulfurtransferase
MQRYDDLIADALSRVREIMPWDLRGRLAQDAPPLLLDVREPFEFARCRIAGSRNVPRGVLEQSCEWDYEETVPELARGREREIVVICRSGKRSVLAADTLLRMGFCNVVSLKTGVVGWKDFEQNMVNENGEIIDPDAADILLAQRLRPEQRKPNP